MDNNSIIEEAKKAACENKEIKQLLAKEWKHTGFYTYCDVDGNFIYARIRLDPPTGSSEGKWIRPFYFDGKNWVFREPPTIKEGKKTLYLLERIVKNRLATIWITEGEKCVDLLVKLGLEATTSGAWSSAANADWSCLANRNTIIWRDHDDVGLKYAIEVTKRLLAIGCSVMWIDTEKLNLPAKGDCIDWFAVNPKATAADIETLLLIAPNIEKVCISNNGLIQQKEKIPLQRQIPEPDPFPVSALGSLLSGIALKMEEIIKAPLAICGQSVLAAATLATQGFANVFIDGRIIPLSCFFLTVGKTGERKSAIDAAALKPHMDYQRQLADLYDTNFKIWEKELAAYEAAKKQALNGKNKTYDSRLAALKALGDPPIKPIEYIFIAEEPTYEGLFKLLENGLPSIGLFSDEGARFIGGYGMNNENMLKTAAGLCGMWDGKSINRVRAGDGAIMLTGRRVAFHLMAQPEIAQILLSNELLQQQGLLSRCLTTFPNSTAGARPYCAENLYQQKEFLKYEQKIEEILIAPKPLMGKRLNELAPRNLSISVEAKLLWIKFHNTIEVEIRDGGLFSAIRGLANKAAEHALRIAGVLTLINDLNSVSISLKEMRSAIQLVEYYLNEALRLVNMAAVDPKLTKAEKLLQWLHEKNKQIITLVEIYQYSLNSIRTAQVAREIMEILVKHGHATPLEGGANFEGVLRKEAWSIDL